MLTLIQVIHADTGVNTRWQQYKSHQFNSRYLEALVRDVHGREPQHVQWCGAWSQPPSLSTNGTKGQNILLLQRKELPPRWQVDALHRTRKGARWWPALLVPGWVGWTGWVGQIQQAPYIIPPLDTGCTWNEFTVRGVRGGAASVGAPGFSTGYWYRRGSAHNHTGTKQEKKTRVEKSLLQLLLLFFLCFIFVGRFFLLLTWKREREKGGGDCFSACLHSWVSVRVRGSVCVRWHLDCRRYFKLPVSLWVDTCVSCVFWGFSTYVCVHII